MVPNRKTHRKLKALREMLRQGKNLLIVMQNYPDPDAIASAAALRELANSLAEMPCTVTSSGVVGRAENRALMRYMRLPFHPLAELDLSKFDLVALVDTQPNTGNNGLPTDFRPQIVLDHHPCRRATRSAPFTDVRRHYGATSTILYEYLVEARVEIETQLATALLYGIRSDTQDLGREASRADVEAVLALYPRANNRTLGEIQNSKTPRSYFRMLEAALRNADVYGSCIIACVGQIDVPDVVGEIADLLLRDEKSTWTLCYGFFEERLLLSIRTEVRGADAGRVMQRIVKGLGTGGGHNAMAGGQVQFEGKSIPERRAIEELIRKRFLRTLRATKRYGERLIVRHKSSSPQEG
jgi:nanoRNase/pAp phosphatase (c-di-AMP/oligoRNAs hydrolase)